MKKFEERLKDQLYDLSEHQIQAVKEGFVTDFYVEEKFEAIKALIRESLPKENKDHLWADDLHDDYIREFERGFNKCLTDIKQALGLEGEG